MSLPTITGTARLVTDPKRGVTRSNDPWANCVVRFVGYRKTEAGQWEEDSSYAATVVAFGDVARQLVHFAKGDEVEVTGKLKDLSVWTPERGDPRPQLSIVASELTRPEKRSNGRSTRNDDVGPASRRATPDRRSEPQHRPNRADAVRAAVLGQPADRGTAAAPAQDGPVDLAAYRREAGDRLMRQHRNRRPSNQPA